MYKTQRSASKLDDEDDYIRHPKRSGYRGCHLIYRYYNRKSPSRRVFDGMKVEMQFRSSLQHAWATAVETVDVFLREGLKSNRGSPDWRRFFALMGSAIARRENCRLVPKTPVDETSLLSELRGCVEKLNVVTRLTSFGGTLKTINESGVSGAKYLILQLDPSEKSTRLFGYRASQSEEANRIYLKMEREKPPGTDVVLVSVEHANNLRRAYPNYFLDTSLFLDAVLEAIR